jgi:hypothetical protein
MVVVDGASNHLHSLWLFILCTLRLQIRTPRPSTMLSFLPPRREGGRLYAVPQLLQVGAPALPEGSFMTRQQVQQETYNFIRFFQVPPVFIYR